MNRIISETDGHGFCEPVDCFKNTYELLNLKTFYELLPF